MSAPSANDNDNGKESSILNTRFDVPHLSESITRICLAGFGGALAGLSISRRRGSFGAATPSILGKRGLDASSIREEMAWGALPMTWAVGCASFSGVLEASRYLEPMGMILNSVRQLEQKDKSQSQIPEPKGSNIDGAGKVDGENEAKGFLYWDDESTKTLGDYSIAGAIAGAIFQGSRIKAASSSINSKIVQDSAGKSVAANDLGNNKIRVPTGTAKQRRMIGKGKVLRLSKSPKSGAIPPIQSQSAMNTTTVRRLPVKTGAGVLSGLGPGLVLGILAGACQLLLHRLDALTEQQQEQIEGTKGHNDEENDIENEIAKKLEHAKKMSTEEIEQEIQKLKLQLSQPKPNR